MQVTAASFTCPCQVDLFAQSLVFIPVHLGMHWCLAVLDVQRKAIEYYDSMGGNNTRSGLGIRH